jgi:Spy/CpxP family protein refolding chaperone
MQPKTKTILFVILSFILGVAVGWFLESRVFIMARGGEGHGPGDFHKVLAERLHLDQRQIAQVDSILGEHRQRMEEFRKQTLAVRDTIRLEIRKVLNPEQAKLFDGFIQEINSREARRREPPK